VVGNPALYCGSSGLKHLDPQIQKTNVLSVFCKEPSAVSEMKLPTGCDKLLLGQGYLAVTDNCTAMEE